MPGPVTPEIKPPPPKSDVPKLRGSLPERRKQFRESKGVKEGEGTNGKEKNPNSAEAEETKQLADTAVDISKIEPYLSREMLILIRNGGDIGKALEQKGREFVETGGADNPVQVALGLDMQMAGLVEQAKKIRPDQRDSQEQYAKKAKEGSDLAAKTKKLLEERTSNKVTIKDKEIEVNMPKNNQMEEFYHVLTKAAYGSTDNREITLSAAQGIVEEAVNNKAFRKEFTGRLKGELGVSDETIKKFNDVCQTEKAKDVGKSVGKVAGAGGLLMLLMAYSQMKRSGQQQH